MRAKKIKAIVKELNAAPDAWTNEPYELWVETRWQVYDPNLAVIVAEFHNEDDARKYVELRNIDRV